MFDFFKKIKINMTGSAVVTLILGLILVVNPLGMTAAVCSLLGWLLLLMGVFGLCNHFIFAAGCQIRLSL
jgi:uncharacterized membrane protein HdeD (DUF308 family)